jgi:hypothetical protein
VSGTARIRDRLALDAQITALRLHIDAMPVGGGAGATATSFQHGALDALVWITRGGHAPLTGALAVAPVLMELIVGELAAAQDILCGRPSRCRDFARGVDQALMWAQRASATPAPATLRGRTAQRTMHDSAVRLPRCRDDDALPRSTSTNSVG